METHEEILESSWRALCAFIEDLIPEDGSVMPGRIWWTHTNVLHPGEKCEMYDVLPVVGQEEIDFIKKFGNPEAESWRLAMGELRKQKRSRSSEIAQMAERLHDIVFQNPNRLIMSEKRIVENLGIKVRCVPASVFYHGKTGRVSVAWVIHTASADEAMKLAMIAPPNDVKKRGILKDWLRSIPEDVKRVQAELVRSGIEAEKWWID